MHDTHSNQQQPRFHCRHIFTDGLRCGSFCLRGEEFCYYHHNSRRPVSTQELQHRKLHREEFVLPNLEDRSAIQAAISDVLQRITSNEIDPRRAGLLLYGLQIASLNLPKPGPNVYAAETVEEVVEDATFGPIAPRAEKSQETRKKSVTDLLLEELDREFPDDDPIGQIHAVAQPAKNRRCRRKALRRSSATNSGDL
jgi:hypothetical protein